MIDVGSSLGGYELLARLGRGGMATLYLARREAEAGFARLLALELIHPHLVEDERFVQMFVEEARICARLDHPNLVRVEDFGRHGSLRYLVEQYVKGCSLADLMHRLANLERRLSPAAAVHIAIQVADGLHAAHEITNPHGEPLHLVHGDVSPANVLLSYTGHVKLIGFGVAKARGRAFETGGVSLEGKLAYMSPEQATAGPLDGRTDVYALGLLLWEMLTMRRRFDAATDVALLELVRKPTFEPPSRWTRVPPALDAVVARAIAANRDQRPDSARELRRMLAEACPEALSVESAELAELLPFVMRDRVAELVAALPDGASDVFAQEVLSRRDWQAAIGAPQGVRIARLGALTEPLPAALDPEEDEQTDETVAPAVLPGGGRDDISTQRTAKLPAVDAASVPLPGSRSPDARAPRAPPPRLPPKSMAIGAALVAVPGVLLLLVLSLLFSDGGGGGEPGIAAAPAPAPREVDVRGQTGSDEETEPAGPPSDPAVPPQPEPTAGAPHRAHHPGDEEVATVLDPSPVARAGRDAGGVAPDRPAQDDSMAEGSPWQPPTRGPSATPGDSASAPSAALAERPSTEFSEPAGSRGTSALRECLEEPDYNRCIVRRLSHRTQNAAELAALIEAHRTLGHQEVAMRYMRLYVRRHQEGRQTRAYRQYLSRQNAE